MQQKIRDAASGAMQQQGQEKKSPMLDYTLKDPKERVELVNKIIETIPSEKLSNVLLEKFATYIISAMDKKQQKKRQINTENRMVTINKRQTSFEGLISKFENGEDGIYNMIINDKNVLLTPKYQITQEDIDSIPELKKLRDEIEKVEKQWEQAKGKKKYLLKKQIIQMRQDQYVIKSAYKPVTYCLNLVKTLSCLDLSDKLEIDEKGNIVNKGLISLFNPAHVSLLLCNYSKLKESCWDRFQSDLYYLMKDLDNMVDRALKDKYPLYYDLVIYKIDGKPNLEIQQLLYDTYNITYSVEYLSSLWRKKIPKLIAEEEQKRVLIWYYTEVEKGKWKKCSRCGQIKLAHNKFFSKNNTSKDGFFFFFKECRNKKNKQEKG